MKRASIRVQEPTPELIEKIRRARVAISQQKPRYLKCPYCQHNAIAVYEDTRGHVESKCKKYEKTATAYQVRTGGQASVLK